MGAHSDSFVRLLTPALGFVGWACSGPLLATLAVGRAVVLAPSARWLLVALAGWLTLAGIGWLASGRTSARGDGRSRLTRVLDGASGLALLSVPAPLLPLLYLDDASNHLVVGTAGAPRAALVGYVVALAMAGAAWQLVVRHAPRPAASAPLPSGAPLTSGADEEAWGQPRGGSPWPDEALRSPWVLVPMAAVLLMVTVNGGVLRPLQGLGPGDVGGAIRLAVNLACVLAGGGLVARTVGPGWPAGLAACLVWIGFAPLQDALAGQEPVGVVLLSGTAAVIAVLCGRCTIGAILLGLVSAIVPPCGGALVALALLGRVRPAMLGSAVAAALLALERLGALPAGLFGRDIPALSGAAAAVGSTAHISNVALGGFHARLFSGPGALTAEAAAPPPAPALYLTLGGLAAGAWLVAHATLALRHHMHEAGGRPAHQEATGALAPRAPTVQQLAAAAAICLAATSGLVLAGTAPANHLVAALLGVIPLLHVALWHGVPAPARVLAAALFIAGHMFAGTSLPTFARAAADLLSRWPPLASLPALGLILQAAALALLVSTLPQRTAPNPPIQRWLPRPPAAGG
jgi:hypothetical protein